MCIDTKSYESATLYNNVLFQNANDMIQFCSLDGKLRKVNDKWMDIMGYDESEIQNMNIIDIVDPDYRDKCMILFKQLVKGNKLDTYSTVFINKENEQIDVEINASPVYIDGEIKFAMAIIRDIRVRKHMELELQSTNNEIRKYIEFAPIGVIFIDSECIIKRANKKFQEMCRSEQKTLIGIHAESIFNGQLTDAVRNIKKSKTAFGTAEIKRADRVSLNIDYNMTIVDNGDVMIFCKDITKETAITKKLHEALKMNEQIMSDMPVGIMIVDMNKQIKMMNKYALKVTGYNEDELIGKACNDFVCTSMCDTCPVIDKHQELDSSEKIIVNKSGEHIPVLKTVIPVQFDNEDVLLEAFIDMSEQMKAEERLKESEENYKSIFDNLHDIYFRTDTNGKVLMLSPSIKKITGYSIAEVIGKNASIFYKSTDTRKHLSELLIKKGYVENYEVEMVSKNGKHLYMTANAHLVNKGKKEKYIEGTFNDITHLKEIENELRKSKKRQALHFENTPLAVLEWDIDMNIKSWNPAAEHIFGYREKYAVGKNLSDLIIPDNLKHEMMNLKDIISKGKANHNINENITKKGKRIMCEWYNTPLTDDDGNVIGVASAGTDITERMVMEKDIKQLSKAVAQSPVSIVITDKDGNIEYVNPKFTEMTGYMYSEAIGKNPRILKAGTKTENEYKELWDTILSGNIWKGEFQNKRKDGTLFWESASISPIKDKKGNITQFVAVKEDITVKKINEGLLEEAHREMRNINRELQKNIDIANQFAMEAEMANSAKTQFLANMSHEIRTPMNGIMGMTGLLLDSELSREQREYAKIIENSSESLLNIINDILDFSKIEAGKIELENMNYNVRTVMEEMNDIIAVKAQEKNIEYTYFIDNKVFEYIEGDPGRLRQILINLIGNAIKFTKKGFVELLVENTGLSGKSETIRFTVKDTGIGIEKEKLGKIFESFTQADASTTRQYGGTGLGLAISKQLVELMGGELHVKSEQGKGTEFWFELVFNKTEAPNTAVMNLLTDITGLRILHVDDNKTNRRLISEILDKWGIDYMEASDGDSALRILRKEYAEGRNFDIMLTDMIMPEMDGIMLVQRMKSEFPEKQLSVVLMTSITVSDKKGRISEMGFDALINKPIKQETLLNTIRTIKGMDESKIEKEHKNVNKVKQNKSVNILIAEDNITNQKVATLIIKKMGYNVLCVSNGFEAVEAVKNMPYDIVLMDLQMPVMDGYDAAVKIRKEIHSSIPIIAMSADVMKGTSEACLNAGMNDYMSKPVKPDELEKIIIKWTDKPVLQVENGEEKNSINLNIDTEELKRRLTGNWELIPELTEVFFNEAVDIKKKISKKIDIHDYSAIAKEAHKLKGAASSICADKIHKIAVSIENSSKNEDEESLKRRVVELNSAMLEFESIIKEDTWMI